VLIEPINSRMVNSEAPKNAVRINVKYYFTFPIWRVVGSPEVMAEVALGPGKRRTGLMGIVVGGCVDLLAGKTLSYMTSGATGT
jgi:hypothetical protein